MAPSSSSSPSPRAGVERWIRYSLYFDPTVSVNGTYVFLCYLSAVVAVMVLLHSFMCHRDEAYSSMRIQTEVGALALFISSILVLLTTTNPTALKTVVIYDFFFCGVLNLTIQLCETFMFYSRYRAICRIPNFTRYQIHCFIWILCVLPRFPAYNIVPAFYNTNSDLFTYAFNISNACSTACIVLYNFYFTLQFSKILLFIYNPMMIETPFHALEKIKSVGFRSIGHCFTSSLAAVFYIVFPHWGRILQELVIVVGMHFWFNTTIDRDGCLYQLCNLNETLFSESGKDSGGAHSVIDEELRLDMNEINNRISHLVPPLRSIMPSQAAHRGSVAGKSSRRVADGTAHGGGGAGWEQPSVVVRTPELFRSFRNGTNNHHNNNSNNNNVNNVVAGGGSGSAVADSKSNRSSFMSDALHMLMPPARKESKSNRSSKSRSSRARNNGVGGENGPGHADDAVVGLQKPLASFRSGSGSSPALHLSLPRGIAAPPPHGTEQPQQQQLLSGGQSSRSRSRRVEQDPVAATDLEEGRGSSAGALAAVAMEYTPGQVTQTHDIATPSQSHPLVLQLAMSGRTKVDSSLKSAMAKPP